MMKQAQVVKQPVQQKFARCFDYCMHIVRSMFVATPTSPPAFPTKYREWRKTMLKPAIGKTALVVKVDEIAANFATMFIEISRARIAPYYAFYSAAELIDPNTISRPIVQQTWEAVRVLCERNDIDFDALRDELLRFRAAASIGSWRALDCKKNLLRMYHAGEFKGYPVVSNFAALVFVLPFCNALVESLFSVMKYNKSATRSSLKLDTLAAIAHLHDAKAVLADAKAGEHGYARTMGAFGDAPQLDFEEALEHELNWPF